MLDGGNVDEDISSPVLRHDEAIAPLRIEPFDKGVFIKQQLGFKRGFPALLFNESDLFMMAATSHLPMSRNFGCASK